MQGKENREEKVEGKKIKIELILIYNFIYYFKFI